MQRYPARAEATAHRTVGDEALIVNFTDSFFYNLSPVGAFIWERCDGQHSIAQIAAAMVQEFAVEPEVAVRDCEQFVQELVQEGILIWNTAPPEPA
jgi:hypothetical protein